MRLLVTRPEADATRTAQALRALGHEVLVAPLLRIEPVAADFGHGPFDGVLFTSANAAQALKSHPRRSELTHCACLTVGDRSRAAAAETGFVRVRSANGALADLVRLAARRPDWRYLYLAGEDRAGDLAADLARHGIAVDTAVIYRAVPLEKLPPEIAPASLDGVLHYSRRSVATLLHLAGEADALNAVLSLAHYCLSAEVAGPLRAAGARRIAVAASPTESALMTLLK